MNSKYTLRQRTILLVQAGVIAAIYTVLTIIAAGFDLASGAIQVRFSEALTILPFFTPAAIQGLTLGCVISNLMPGGALPDIIFGSLATFLGALGSYYLRRNRFLVSLPPIVSNMLIIPFILSYAYHIPGGIPYFMATVGIGEVLSCLVLGQLLLTALIPFRNRLFNMQFGE